ncbi:MAG: DUF6062 family protein [Roseburia sp.]|nr:DUF6062 family protein [Roseburia sp.]
MRYQIRTAPIWDAYRDSKNGCPLCALHKSREQKLVSQYLADNVMDPDFRVASNAVGFCADHIRAMYAGQNKLGLALQLETRAAALCELIDKPPTDKKSARKTKDCLDAHCGCVICSSLDETMPRYYRTVAEMYGAEDEFPSLFAEATHCVKHATLLFGTAEYAGKKTGAFLADLTASLKRDLKRTEKELRAFADCFDFKNAGARPDPTAITRAIALLITPDIEHP